MKGLLVVLLAFMSIASAEYRAKRQGDPGPCRTCEQILNIAENHFHHNISDESALLNQLHQECTRIGQTEGDAAKRDCLNIVDNNIDKIYSDLHAGKRPRQTCEDIGACNFIHFFYTNHDDNHCFDTTNESATIWCLSHGLDRRIIRPEQVLSDGRRFTQLDQSSGYAWLGLYGNANNVWAWVDGQTVNYTNWAAGEPSTSQGCAKLKKQSGQWYSDDCTGSNDIACELCF